MRQIHAALEKFRYTIIFTFVAGAAAGLSGVLFLGPLGLMLDLWHQHRERRKQHAATLLAEADAKPAHRTLASIPEFNDVVTLYLGAGILYGVLLTIGRLVLPDATAAWVTATAPITEPLAQLIPGADVYSRRLAELRGQSLADQVRHVFAIGGVLAFFEVIAMIRIYRVSVAYVRVRLDKPNLLTSFGAVFLITIGLLLFISWLIIMIFVPFEPSYVVSSRRIGTVLIIFSAGLPLGPTTFFLTAIMLHGAASANRQH